MGGKLGGKDALHAGYLLDKSQRDPQGGVGEREPRGATTPSLPPWAGASFVACSPGPAGRGLLGAGVTPPPFFPQLGRVFTHRHQTASQHFGGSLHWLGGRYSAPSSLVVGTLPPARQRRQRFSGGTAVSGLTYPAA
ncbi:hypothetical protein Misp04_04700 [Micromonospora sp. NBRC 101691]|nr:hypothetical protein Misp04_04700 [Micromonospora sp. NBRC 101691]